MPANPRADALKFLKKKLPGVSFDPEPQRKIESVSSGCLAFDVVAGNGGFPRGRLSEVFGLESSGKTTLCLSACARAQSLGLYPVYIDVERGLDPPFADKIGFNWQDPEKALYVKPDTAEEVFQIIDTMAREGKADLVVVDSVPAMVPEVLMDEKVEITDMGQPAMLGRMMASVLPRLTKIIEKTRTAVVFTNQLRANIEMDAYKARFAPKEKSAGGYALRFYSSLRVEMRQLKKDAKVHEEPSPTDPKKPIQIPVASRHLALAFKNKVATPYRQMEFFIRYDPYHDFWGIDDLQTILDMSLVKGLIVAKGGGHFQYNGTEQMQVRGEDALYDWFSAHPAEIGALKAALFGGSGEQ